jgi:hypothetical protein
MAAIVLATLNARYTHASLGLRYLRANLGAYRAQSMIREFTTKRAPQEIAAEILQLEPRVVGFGVYIWNTTQTLAVIRHLKTLRPDLPIVVGGPEISYETEGRSFMPRSILFFKARPILPFAILWRPILSAANCLRGKSLSRCCLKSVC